MELITPVTKKGAKGECRVNKKGRILTYMVNLKWSKVTKREYGFLKGVLIGNHRS